MGTTITTYLINDNPSGVRYIILDNRICKLWVIPRSELGFVRVRPELSSPAFYMLLGNSEFAQPKAYLGETESFVARVKDHDSKKDFWNRALIFVSKDGSMHKGEVQFLEYLAMNQARKADKYNLSDNKQTPKAPNLPEHVKSSAEGFFEDVMVLTAFVNCNIFEETTNREKEVFYLKGRGIEASGYYDEKGFTVLAGGGVHSQPVPSFTWNAKRQAMIAELCDLQGDRMSLKRDFTFTSPSAACDFCLGSSNNGWLAWKDGSGKTLDSVYRNKFDKGGQFLV